jgi:hypothetical protein
MLMKSKAAVIKRAFRDAMSSHGFESEKEVARKFLDEVIWVVELTKLPRYADEYDLFAGVFVRGIPENESFAIEYKFSVDRLNENHCHIRYVDSILFRKLGEVESSGAFNPKSELEDEKRIEFIRTVCHVAIQQIESFKTVKDCCSYTPRRGEVPRLGVLVRHCEQLRKEN